MKKLLSLASLLTLAVALWAQSPVITFEKSTHDFGQINEIDGRVTTVFTFKNQGMVPLVLSEVRASCGCTTPKWTREPVEPGQTGAITVTYNPNGRPGRFNKTITVTSNAEPSVTKLYIKGEVIPKSATPVDNYPVKVAQLSLKADNTDFGKVTKGATVNRTIEYANQSKDTIVVECVANNAYMYASAHASERVATILPNTKGELQIALFTADCPLYGPIDGTISFIINGVQMKADKEMIKVAADIVEDFSGMTEEQMAAAPIADINGELNLGTFAAGKRAKAAFHIANAGENTLDIRRIVNKNNTLKIVPAKSVKSGKKGTFKVEMQPMEKGSYSSEITIITNDPKNAVKTVVLRWTID